VPTTTGASETSAAAEPTASAPPADADGSTAQADATTDAAPATSEPEATDATGLALADCHVENVTASCGTVDVPVNPAEPDGEQLSLRIAVVKALQTDAMADPIFYLADLGRAAIEDDLVRTQLTMSYSNDVRDVVYVDQRGTGGSNAVTCTMPNDADSAGADLAAVTAAARSCAADAGPGLQYYTTAVAAEDLDRVREALGYDKLNLYGVGYGSYAAQAYLARHGDRVRSAFLDGGSTLDVHAAERTAAIAQRSLTHLFARCTADADCHQAYPDLSRDYARADASLDQHPLQVPGADAPMDRAAFAGAIASMLGDTHRKTAIPQVIHAVATGRATTVAEDLAPALRQPDALAAATLIRCTEPWASLRPDPVARASAGTFLAPFEARAATRLQAACRGLPHPALPADLRRPIHSDARVVIFTGGEDAASAPAEWAHAAQQLPNSTLVVFPGAGGDQIHSTLCARNIFVYFLDPGTLGDEELDCAKTDGILPFDT
jgi:pimeloyl-ACP methyl ester carboxylesterase